MQLERIVLETNHKDWGNKPYTRETEYVAITKKEVEDLKTWLTSSQVSFKGFQGKVYFHKDTEFPRYKFTEYSRNNNKIVRRVKEIKNADVIVLDINRFLPHLDRLLKNVEHFEKEIVSKTTFNKDGLPMYIEKQSSMAVKKMLIGSYNHEKHVLETLTELYNKKNTLKFVSVYELTDTLTKTGTPIDTEMANNLKNLFNSNDDASIKLAMEIMTNADFESSLLHITLLCTTYRSKIVHNSYWNSTAFKSFRNNMNRLELQIEYLQGDTMDSLQKFLSVPDKFVFEDDIDFIKKCIKEEVDSTYNLERTGFELTHYDIKLNLDPNKIIKNKPEETKQEEVESTI